METRPDKPVVRVDIRHELMTTTWRSCGPPRRVFPQLTTLLFKSPNGYRRGFGAPKKRRNSEVGA